MLTLYIGNKNLSSWSLRPWLALKAAGAEFAEKLIVLRKSGATVYREGLKPDLLAVNPAGHVPVLHDGDLAVWDSLAICEYAAELFPSAGLWPAEPKARAKARSLAAEMHSGFADMRREMSMDISGRHPGGSFSAAARADADRVIAIWEDCLAKKPAGGPFLFGRFGIVDAMFAPVATRFRTYEIALPPASAAYAAAVFAFPPMAEWCEAAAAEVAAERAAT